MVSTLARPADAVRIGVIAGVAGRITLDAYLITTLLAGHAGLQALGALYQRTAAVLIGPTAILHPSFIPIGVLLGFAVSVFWALGYVYLARTQPQLLARPVVSGLGFGVVVYLFMQIVLVGANQFTPPTPSDILRGLIASCVFYGMVVALVVARLASGTQR